MVVIRLARGGSKKRPFYSIVVADSRYSRDGRFIEQLGFYNPIARGGEIPLKLNLESLDAWVAKGAQLSDRVKALARQARRGAGRKRGENPLRKRGRPPGGRSSAASSGCTA